MSDLHKTVSARKTLKEKMEITQVVVQAIMQVAMEATKAMVKVKSKTPYPIKRINEEAIAAHTSTSASGTF